MTSSYKNLSYDKLLKLIKEVQSNTKYFKRIKEVGDNILVSCPYHKGGQENKPSCGIHINTLVYHCFSCGSAGNFIEMMYDIYQPIDIEQIKNDRDEVRIHIENDRNKVTEQLPVIHVDYQVGLTKYLQNRGLTSEICQKYLVGYKGDLVVFPVRNLQGEIIFYTTRNVNRKEYTLSNDSKPLYGWYELFRDNEVVDYCFVVESVFNCLTLVNWGFKAIALLGTGSRQQIEKLKNSKVRHFLICMDGDEAGIKGLNNIKKNLSNKIVTPVYIYEGKDVNDLTREQFSKLLIANEIREEDLL